MNIILESVTETISPHHGARVEVFHNFPFQIPSILDHRIYRAMKYYPRARRKVSCKELLWPGCLCRIEINLARAFMAVIMHLKDRDNKLNEANQKLDLINQWLPTRCVLVGPIW